MKRPLEFCSWIFIFCQIIYAPSYGISFAFKDIASSLNKSSKSTADKSLGINESTVKASSDCGSEQVAPTSNEVDNKLLNEALPESKNYQFSSTSVLQKNSDSSSKTTSTLFQTKPTFEQQNTKLEEIFGPITNKQNLGLPISSRVNTNQVSSQIKMLPEVAPSLAISNRSPLQPPTSFGLNIERTGANTGLPPNLNTAVLTGDRSRTLSTNSRAQAASAKKPTTNGIVNQCSHNLLTGNAGIFRGTERNVSPKNVAQSSVFPQSRLQDNKIIQSPLNLNKISKHTQQTIPNSGTAPFTPTVIPAAPKTKTLNNNLDQTSFTRNTDTATKCQVSPISVGQLQNNNKAFSVAQNPSVMLPRSSQNNLPISGAVKDLPSRANNILKESPITPFSPTTPTPFTSSHNLLSHLPSQLLPNTNSFKSIGGSENKNNFNQKINSSVKDVSCKTNAQPNNQNYVTSSPNNVISLLPSQPLSNPNSFDLSKGISNVNDVTQNNNFQLRDVSCTTTTLQNNQNNIASYGLNVSRIEPSPINQFSDRNIFQFPTITPLQTLTKTGPVSSKSISPSMPSTEIVSYPGCISSVTPNTQPTNSYILTNNPNISPQTQQALMPRNSIKTAPLSSGSAYVPTATNYIGSCQPQTQQTFMPINTAILNSETFSGISGSTVSTSGNFNQHQLRQPFKLPNLGTATLLPSVEVNVPTAFTYINSFQPQTQQSLAPLNTATISPVVSAGMLVPTMSSPVTSFLPQTQQPLIHSNKATINPISSAGASVTPCAGTVQAQMQYPLASLNTATSATIPTAPLPTQTTSGSPILPQISRITINIQPTSENLPTNIMIPGYDITQLASIPIVPYTNVDVPTLPPVDPSPIVTPPVVTTKSGRRSKKLKRLLEVVLLSQLMGDRRSINLDTLGSVLPLLYS